MQQRNLCDIAEDIKADWERPYYGAVPYIEAMAYLTSIKGTIGSDSAQSIVRYFLNNSATWRGGNARRIKAELRAMLPG